MVNARDCARLVKPALAARDDLVALPYFVVLTPIRSLFRGCHIRNCGDRNKYYLRWVVHPLCDDTPWPSMGRDIKYPHYVWRLDDPVDRKLTRNTILNAVVPILQRVRGLEDMPSFLEELRESGTWTDWDLAVIWAALGEFRKAHDELDRAFEGYVKLLEYSETLIAKWKPGYAPLMYRRNLARRDLRREGVAYMKRFRHNALHDPRALLAELQENEARAIAYWKLEKHWIPTPFPCETRGIA